MSLFDLFSVSFDFKTFLYVVAAIIIATVVTVKFSICIGIIVFLLEALLGSVVTNIKYKKKLDSLF